MCELYKYGYSQYPRSLDSTDILRAAVVMAVSSLDLLVHAVFRTEVALRTSSRKDVARLLVPFQVAVADPAQVPALIDAHIYSNHAYKSFVAPDKIAELLCQLIESPWEKISAEMGGAPKEVKSRLREIVRWRNRIAHEADINPTYGGIELWPVRVDDVETSLQFLEELGEAIAAALS
jgi:hypothetical protein